MCVRNVTPPVWTRAFEPGAAATAKIAACGLAIVAIACAGIAGARLNLPAGSVLAVLVVVLGSAVAVLFASGRDRAPARDVPDDVVPVSALADLVTWHDLQGDVLRASPAAQDVLATAPMGLLGDGLLRRVHVADRPAFLKSLSDAANGQGTSPVRMRILGSPVGSSCHPKVVFAEMRAQRLSGPVAAGAPAVVAFIRDLSAQHKHADELELAKQDAEKANELKGRFLATVSHELRTPLNAIIGFSELLGADHPFLITEERRKEYANIIRNSGLHLLEIVNTLLDMSKIETGNFNFDPESFDIRELATSVCDLMQLKADEAGITVERKLDAALPELLADRRACRQILINLLSNALKFTPSGGMVTIRLAPAADAIVLSVADDGIGIPEADLPRLGDPFFQSGDVHRRNQEGTGLGLSVVRGIVGLHHGQITVESGAGAGTTVTVTLPLRPDLATRRTKPVVVQTRPRVAIRPIERKIA